MAKKDRAKAAQRRAAREERREAQRRAAARQRRQRTLTWTAVGALVLVVAALLLARSGALGNDLAALLGRPRPAPPAPAASPAAAAPQGTSATLQPREERPRDAGTFHIAPGKKGQGYTSNPPTSGEHYPGTVPWGVHNQVFPDELIIHNLEHAGVWISYRDPNDSELAGKLAQIVDRYRTKVILTPRPANDAPIALAAWGHLLKLQVFDEARIVAFIEAYRGKVGPEPDAP